CERVAVRGGGRERRPGAVRCHRPAGRPRRDAGSPQCEPRLASHRSTRPGRAAGGAWRCLARLVRRSGDPRPRRRDRGCARTRSDTVSTPRIGFVIGGMQKAGTSALTNYLAEHPALRLPTGKEAHVFDAPAFDESATAADIDAAYAPHFPPGASDALHGDATPIYAFHPRLVARIARYNPAMRWIVLLRHPVDRALSHFHMERGRGKEYWPLWPAMLLERWRLRGHR